jgi:hypothetical protein
MLTAINDVVPIRVRNRFEANESHIATLDGLLESGFALTDRRVIAWRANGVAIPLPLAAIERMLIDIGIGGQHADVVVVPRQAVHVPLVLMLRLADLDHAVEFAEQAGQAAGVTMASRRCGPVVRFTFGRA